jgi:hypothetical protein
VRIVALLLVAVAVYYFLQYVSRFFSGLTSQKDDNRYVDSSNARILLIEKQDFVEPWSSIDDCQPSHKAGVEKEVQRELAADHTLFGAYLYAIATRMDRDDVLFQVGNTEKVALVHLTWSGKLESSGYPRTVLFESLDEFMNTKMKEDSKDYCSGGKLSQSDDT